MKINAIFSQASQVFTIFFIIYIYRIYFVLKVAELGKLSFTECMILKSCYESTYIETLSNFDQRAEQLPIKFLRAL